MRAAAALLTLWGGLAAAQETRPLTGTVLDGVGAPVAEATVVLTQGDAARTTTTDAAGRFHFDGAAAGRYALLATYARASARAEGEGAGPVTLKLDLEPEVIRIHEAPPVPAVQPKVVPSTMPRRWAYSDELVDRNEHAVVWVLVRLDDRGRLDDARVLKSPPALHLDAIALAAVRKMRFEPARDANGRTARYEGVIVMEWPPYWGGGKHPPCKGSGPLNLDRENPAYRDCEPPKGYEHLRLPSLPDPATINPGPARTPLPPRF